MMSAPLISTFPAIPAMSLQAIDKVREFERVNLQRPQLAIVTHHLIHAGMYHRTITLPAGTELTGVLVKIPTTLVVSGDVTVVTGESPRRLTGYSVLPATAHRKQAFHAHAETHLTMSFATTASSVEEAEREFTDEADLLFSRTGENVINITGETT